MRSFRIDFQSAGISRAVKTPTGALRIPAYLSRTGIFEYKRSDGTSVRELRLPEEVFSVEALDSFKGAPLTVGHPGKVTADSWKAVAVGHVSEDVHSEFSSDGNGFVAASVLIQDAHTIGLIEKGELVELSCGYECETEATNGQHNGEKYDSIQRKIVGNHVAIGPKDWGRAGPDVKLYLDSKGALVVEGQTLDLATTYTLSEPIDIPAKDVKASNVDLETALKEIETLKASAEKLSAEKDSALAKVTSLETQISAVPSTLDSKLNLRLKAKKLVGDSYDFVGKSDREVLVAGIVASDPSFKHEEKSDAYLEARFDFALEQGAVSKDALAKLNQDSVSGTPGTEDKMEAARKRMLATNAAMWRAS